MRRALLFALLPLLSEGQVYRRGSDRSRRGAAVSARVLPAGGGQTTAHDPCLSLDAADMAGNWFCLQGTAAATTGSDPLTASGSPATSTLTVVPSGPNGSAPSFIAFDGVDDKFATTTARAAVQDFSVCTCWQRIGTAADQFQLGKSDTAANFSWNFRWDSRNCLTVWKNDAASSAACGTVAEGSHPVGAWQGDCATYDFVADGTSVGKVYERGVQSGSTVSTMVGPPATTASIPITVGALNNGNFKATNQRAVFYTEKVLDATAAARWASACEGRLSGANAETITLTRASNATCTATDGTVVTLPSGRPCVTKGALLIEPAGTNLAVRSEEFENASWVSVGTPTPVTANTTVAPDGLTTADTVGDDAAGAFEGKQQTITTTAGQPYMLSVYAKAGTSTKLRLSNDGTTCDFTVTSNWARYTCADASASGASTVQQVLVGNVIGDTGTLILWGAQFENNTVATSYIQTTTSSATRAALEANLIAPGMNSTSGCVAATIELTASVGTNGRIVNFAGGVNSGTMFNGTGADIAIYDGSTFSTVTVASVFGRKVRVIGRWDGSGKEVCVDGTCSTKNATAGSMISSTTANLGGTSGSTHITGYISDVQFGLDPGACQ